MGAELRIREIHRRDSGCGGHLGTAVRRRRAARISGPPGTRRRTRPDPAWPRPSLSTTTWVTDSPSGRSPPRGPGEERAVSRRPARPRLRIRADRAAAVRRREGRQPTGGRRPSVPGVGPGRGPRGGRPPAGPATPVDAARPRRSMDGSPRW